MTVDVREIRDPEVAALARDAEAFLASHMWCGQVGTGRLAFAIPAVLGVFLFDVVPNQPDVDSTLWVVVGDLPPAYIALPPAASWQEVLAGYVDEMQRWVAAVRAGAPVGDLIPVAAAPTLEYADLLARRLEFLETNLIAVPADSVESAG